MMVLQVYSSERKENRMVKLVNMMDLLANMMDLLANMKEMLVNNSVMLVCILVKMCMAVVCHQHMMDSLTHDWISLKNLVKLANKPDLLVNNAVMMDSGLLANMLDYLKKRD